MPGATNDRIPFPPLQPSKFQWTDLLSFELREIIRQNSELSPHELSNTIASWLASKLAEHVSKDLLTAAENLSISNAASGTLDISNWRMADTGMLSGDIQISAIAPTMRGNLEMVLPEGHALLRTLAPA